MASAMKTGVFAAQSGSYCPAPISLPELAWADELSRRESPLNDQLRALLCASAFGSVDKAGNVFVFDVGGNKARIVAAIHFNRAKVFVRYVLTHAEYDRGDWNEACR
ncbi:MAG: type II toxin-antitoxin system HigB family toxin [Gammaproteobacteria bacterium]